MDDKDIAGLDLGSWRCAFNGAEAVSPAILEGFIERFSRFECDGVVGYRGRTVLLEVKTKGGKLTEDQKKFFQLFRGEAYIVRTPERAIEVMTRGKHDCKVP